MVLGAAGVDIAEGAEKIEAAGELVPKTNGALLLAVEELEVAPNTIGVLLLAVDDSEGFNPNENPLDCDVVPKGAAGLGDGQPNTPEGVLLPELTGALTAEEELETFDADVEPEVKGLENVDTVALKLAGPLNPNTGDEVDDAD